MFCSDYPRRLPNCLWLWWFPAFHPLAVTPALAVPFLLARRLLPVALLCLPLRPLPCRLPATLAAIPLARLPRMKTLLAAFQQTPPRPEGNPPPAGLTLPPASPLIFGMACRIL